MEMEIDGHTMSEMEKSHRHGRLFGLDWALLYITALVNGCERYSFVSCDETFHREPNKTTPFQNIVSALLHA
eukprot:scaffold3440_cov120-Skeletonema_marinoi.AAC.2